MKKIMTLVFTVLLTISTAQATTYTVTQITDDGTGTTSGSLSWAINTAAATGDVIAFNLTTGDVVTLSAALPTIDKSFTMEGINIATGNPVTIQVATPGVSTFRVFYILFSAAGKTITLNDLILRGGNVGSGGVVYFSGQSSSLNLNRCVIRDGYASNGGGIVAAGYLIMNQCTITENNTTGLGAGLYIFYGKSSIINSTITANVASLRGGGVYINTNSYCTIINTTICSNTANTAGGVLGGGVYANNTTNNTICVALNSIFINNTGGDFGSPGTSPFSYGYYSWKNTGRAWKGTNVSAPNIANSYTAGDLGSLSNNGGATPTMQLSATAPAYQTGSYAYYNATDGYYYKGTDNLYYKLAITATAFTPATANPENDKITTDQRGATRSATPSMGAYDGTLLKPMKLKFTTTADENYIKLPLYGTVDCTVDWGDGSATETFNTTGRKRHTYATAGTYTVSISGTLTQFGYYDDENEEGWSGSSYLNEVADFGSVGLTSLSGAFAQANNLSSVPATLPATVTDLSYCFYLNDKASITNLNLWDVSHVTNMSATFLDASAFNQNISTWDVSAVTNMKFMFKRASAFNQPIGTWNVSSATNMEEMFRSADVFNQPIGTWIVSGVTNMDGMFETADAFNQDISNWNVGSVTSMSSMFDWAISFNQNINKWDVSHVTDMSWMFSGAIAFNQSLAGWNISSVTTMEDMFADVTLSTANYDALLIGWAAQTVKPNVVFSGGNSKYTAGAAATARGTLAGGANLWTITDGGIDDIGTGVDTPNNVLSLQVSPNPVRNQLRINGLFGNAEITIMDLTGKIFQKEQVSSASVISVGHLPKGMYVVQVNSGNDNTQLKFIKF